MTPSTGFGGALTFLASCSQVSLYGFSSAAMPPRGNIQAHAGSFAEQTLLLKVLPDRIDKLAINKVGAKKLNMSTKMGFLREQARLRSFNYTLVHHLKGVPGYFAGQNPEELCNGRQIRDPEWEAKNANPPIYGYWGH